MLAKEKNENPFIKEEKGSEGGEYKGIFGTKPLNQRGLFTGGTPFTAVAPRLNNPAGSAYPPSLPSPPPPPQLPRAIPDRASSSAAAASPSGAQVRAARKERDTGVAEVTGSSANRNQDIHYWEQQSPNELKAQLNLRHPNRGVGVMTEWAFAKKPELIAIIKRMIDNGTW